MIHKFFNGKVILGNTFAKDGTCVYTDGERITKITTEDLPFDISHDAKGGYISPGFIDIHVHGAMGSDLRDATEEAILTVAKLHSQYGTTVLLPTLGADSTENYVKFFETYKSMNLKDIKGSYMPGVHMEAPYFSKLQAGAQGPYIRDFDKEEYTMLIEKYGHLINRWSAAPELEGCEDFARMCRDNGIRLSIGHSDAEYDRAIEAFDMGFKCVTHLYSCVSTVHRKNAFRYAGILEAAYMLDEMDVEIIADGRHLPASLLKFAVKHKGTDRIAIITDATRFGGMQDGAEKDYNIKDIIIEDGVAKLPDRSAFAGSICTTNRLVRNMIELSGVSLLDSVKMATVNPARMAGLAGRGALLEGNYADIIIFDKDINVSLTMVNGNVVFEEN